jgi:hypothetical protein
MTHRDELIKSIRTEIADCEEFLARASEASELAPAVQKRKQDAEARLRAFQIPPEEVFVEMGPEMMARQEREAQRLHGLLPSLPRMDVEYITMNMSGTSSSTDSELMAKLVRVDPSQVSWYPAFIAPLSGLVRDQDTEDQIIQSLNSLNPDLRRYAVKALSTTSSALGGVASVDLACQHLRSVIQKTWGELAAQAISLFPSIKNQRLGLSKEAHRKTVAKHLSASIGNTEQVEEILAAISSLYMELSGSAKDPFQDDIQYLDDVFTRWKLHLTNLFQALGV